MTATPVSQPPSARDQNWAAAWATGWNSFWFTPSDPLLLSVLRILTGCLLTWSSLVWLLDAEGFFGSTAWQAADNVWRMNDQPWHWSWYFSARTPSSITLLATVSLIAATMLTLGLATPLAAVVSLVGYVSAVNRAPLNTFGFDDAVGLMLLPLAVGPAGARLSLDRLLWRRSVTAAAAPRVSATVAIRLIQVHLCVVYFFSGAGKLFGASWWEGTALWGAVANSQYRTLDLTFLAWHPLLTNALTLSTLFWEFSYPALVWPRLTRRLVLAMAVLVHLGIGLAMGMMEFGLAMIVANMAFLPPGLGLTGSQPRPAVSTPSPSSEARS